MHSENSTCTELFMGVLNGFATWIRHKEENILISSICLMVLVKVKSYGTLDPQPGVVLRKFT